MATVKSYTSLQQSLKLAEILPLESADMEYLAIKENSKLVGNVPFVKDDSEVEDSAYSHIYDRIACWSLAALLGVLPNDTSLLYFDDAYQMVYDKKPYVISNKFDNPVDACYEIIIRLHELNLL